jgi:hypothetical protein
LVPNGVAGHTGIFGIKVGLGNRAGAKRVSLGESETCRAGYTILVLLVPGVRSITFYANAFGIFIRLVSWAGANGKSLVEDFTCSTGYTSLVFSVPGAWSLAWYTFILLISFELALALAFLRSRIPGFGCFANKASFGCWVPYGSASLAYVLGVQVGLAMRTVTSSCFFIRDEASGAGHAL